MDSNYPCKILVVTGGVMSGIGKGVVTASIGSLLLANNIPASAMKLDGYLNQDAGTLNPFRHGETYVLEDGTECDLDLGTYERFMGISLTKDNYYTAGRIYQEVFEREREGYYLGEDVQVTPHVTGYMKEIIRKAQQQCQGGILLVEVGGTIGDIENHLFIQALSELQDEEDVILKTIHVVPVLASNKGELKTKPAQQSIAKLREWGLTPNFVVCRLPEGHHDIPEPIKQKFLTQSKIKKHRLFTSGELSSIYMLPFLLQQEGILGELYDEFGESTMTSYSPFFETIVGKLPSITETINIGIVGKYAALQDSYLSVIESLRLAGYANNVNIQFHFVNCRNPLLSDIDPSLLLSSFDGIVVPGGYGIDGTEEIMRYIQGAREGNIPFLGLCFGFQLALIEYARTIFNWYQATSMEFDPTTECPVITEMPEYNIARKGKTQRLGLQYVERNEDELTPVTKDIFSLQNFGERFRHRFIFNAKYREVFGKYFQFPLHDPVTKEVFAFQLKNHPFFIGVQFHPEYNVTNEQAHPLFEAFIQATKVHTQK